MSKRTKKSNYNNIVRRMDGRTDDTLLHIHNCKNQEMCCGWSSKEDEFSQYDRMEK